MGTPGQHIEFDEATARPQPPRGVLFELWRWAGMALLRLWGWRMQGDWPTEPRMVLVCAPHTSNWDGVWLLAAAGYWRVRLRYMGKASLTKGVFGGFVRWTGCIPVDRSRSNDLVEQMRQAFAATPDLVLAIPPEGSRSAMASWKSGYYYIAVAAGVPIVFAVLDYAHRIVRISGLLWPSGDLAADFAIVRSHYVDAGGKHPERFVLPPQ